MGGQDKNKTINQHYVPQTYLEEFTVDGTRESRLYTFDKINNKIFPWNVGDAASTDYFYDITPDQKVESLLSRLEGLYAEAKRTLLEIRDLNKMEDEEILNIAYFLAFQDLRTRGIREKIMDMSEYFIEEELDKNPKTEWENEVHNFVNSNTTDEGSKRLQLSLIGYGANEFVKSLDGERWILFENQTNIPFWTSDHPVVRYNLLKPDKFHNPGILGRGGSGYQIHLPISPDLTLTVCDIDYFSRWSDHYEITDKDKVMFRNKLQVIQSWRHIFSPKENFDYAKEVVHDESNFPDDDSERFDGVF